MNRAVMAARAAQSDRKPRTSGATCSTNLLLRPDTVLTPSGHIPRSRAVSLTATQHNSIGKRSEWAESPEFFTDPKWSATAYTNKAV